MSLRKLLWALLAVCIVWTPARAADSVSEAVMQGHFRGELRLYSFDSDFDQENKSNSKDTALGGLFYYQTDPLKNISVGVAARTGFDLGNSKSDSTYLLLPTNDENERLTYGAMQEYWIKGEWADTAIKIGAQQVNTPFLNGHDIRMMPKSYRGVSVENKSFENWVLQAMHFTDILGWTDSNFQSLSHFTDRTGTVTEDRGVSLVGAVWKPVKNLQLEAYDYQFWDMYNDMYGRIKYDHPFNDTFTGYVDLRYLAQNTVGKNLLNKEDSYMLGAGVGIKAYGADLQFVYANIGDDDIENPGGGRLMLLQQVAFSKRAEDNVYAGILQYDFGYLGLTGLTGNTSYGYYDSTESGPNASFDIKEWDFMLRYKFSDALKGWRATARYAIVDGDNSTGGADYDRNDLRFQLTYKFAFDLNELLD